MINFQIIQNSRFTKFELHDIFHVAKQIEIQKDAQPTALRTVSMKLQQEKKNTVINKYSIRIWFGLFNL